ncbi:MAG: hypothetical protein JST70_13675 [Bacteroidetes bacterium]|nr:hypothetical protein [Bacteroidota bacterium]
MYLLIPVDLCFDALRKKRTRQLQLFIFLKGTYGGKVILSPADRLAIADALGLDSERTIRNTLKTLVKWNWLGFDDRTGCYYIRSFEYLQKCLHSDRRSAAVFLMKDISQFKAYLCGAVISYLVNAQKTKKWLDARASGRASQSSHFYKVANKALSKILGCSLSTASEYKRLAHHAGFITVKPVFTRLDMKPGERYHFAKGLPEMAHKLAVQGSVVFIRDADQVLGWVTFRRRKKLM